MRHAGAERSRVFSALAEIPPHKPLPAHNEIGAGLLDWRTDMSIIEMTKRSWRGLVAAVALVGAVALSAAPSTAYAHGGIGPGAAVGIGLGAFALGTALSAGAYGYPYGYYPYGYYPPVAYYPPAPYYPAPRSCWNPYYRTYYPC